MVVVGDPAEVWSVQPTFLIAEGLFLVLALWGVIDAMRRQRGGLTFLAALVGGSAIELVTIMHEEVGNFYHSQATIMLFGRREPAYMRAHTWLRTTQHNLISACRFLWKISALK